MKTLPLLLLVLLSSQAVAHQENPKKSVNCICAQIWKPVCGENGKTYSNTCVANCAHVKVAKKGQCPGKSK